MKVREEVWIIWDDLDGPHLFQSEAKARSTLKKWVKEAEKNNDMFDSVYDMVGPIKYIRGSS